MQDIKITVLNYKYLLIFFVIGLYQFPLLIRYPVPSLDSSWGIGISMAFSEGLHFGEDIVFSFGLLGFLENPLINDYVLWEVTIIFLVFIHFLFLFALYLLLRSFSAQWYHYLLFIPILILIVPLIRPHWGLLLSTSIFLYLILIHEKRSRKIYFCLVFIALLLALNSFIKFDMMVNSIVLIILFCILLFFTSRKTLEGIVLAISYLVLSFMIWVLTGQNLFNIHSYISGGLEITRGYTSAMSLPGPVWQVVIGIVVLFLFGILFAWFITKRKKELYLFLLMNGFIIFSAFKSVFVRHERFHVMQGMWIFLVLLAVLIIAIDMAGNIRTQEFSIFVYGFMIIFIIILAGLITYSAPEILQSNAFSYSNTNQMAFGWTLNRTDYEKEVIQQKGKLMESYAIKPELIQNIGDSPTDIIPWDIALAWAYSLNWSPRPVFQSYSAYTPYLDNANSRHMGTGNFPEKILFSFKSIDGRYPLFDEPRTFSSILNNYTFVNQSGEFILLTRSLNTSPGGEEQLGFAVGKMGESIPVPDYDGKIFGKIHVRYSPFGGLMNVIYKPDPVYIRFKLKNGVSTQRYRFIPATAGNGIFLSQFIGDTDTLAWLLKGNLFNDIGSIIIETDHPEQYVETISITYTGIPHTLTSNDSFLLSHPIIFEKVIHQEHHPSYSFVTINRAQKVAFFEHPMPGGSVIRMDNVSLENKSLMQGAIALDPQVWYPEKGDGVEFRIYVNSPNDENLVFSRYIDPKNNPDERKWNTFEAGLSSYKDENVTFYFSTFPGTVNNTAWDWAWWGDIKLV